jgi:hypothetical protein
MLSNLLIRNSTTLLQTSTATDLAVMQNRARVALAVAHKERDMIDEGWHELTLNYSRAKVMCEQSDAS